MNADDLIPPQTAESAPPEASPAASAGALESGAAPVAVSPLSAEDGHPSPKEGDSVPSEAEQNNVALEHCPKCGAILDVTGCELLTQTSCPVCGEFIKVLKQFHHFTLLSELGRGGAGVVYRAFDESLERDVALKVLRHEVSGDAAFAERLEAEAALASSINHPHVVKVHSAGRHGGSCYVAMEVISGGSIAERINRTGILPEAEVCSIGIQAAEGLHAAYERGLLHRDIKPGNLLVKDDGTIKVTDFGLSIPVEDAAGKSAHIWGAPDFFAPEKLLREGEDVRSDIYSLGCALFQCLTGRLPYGSRSLDQSIEFKTQRDAPSVQLFQKKISGAMAAVIKRCLERDPSARYQRYPDLIDHLQQIRGQAAPSAVPAGAARSPRPGASVPGAARAVSSPAHNAPKSKVWLWAAGAGVGLAAAVTLGVVLKGNPATPVKSHPAVAAVSAPPPVAPAPAVSAPPSSLVAYWKFDESSGSVAADSTGKNRAAEARGNVIWTAGRFGNALQLDGSASMSASAPLDPKLTRTMSVAGWFKASDNGKALVSVVRHDGSFTALQHQDFGRFSLWLASKQALDVISYPWKYSDGVWHHFAAIYDSNHGARMYIDGKKVASNDALRGELKISPNAFLFGRADNGTETYKGALDDIAVWNRPLTETEVADLAAGRARPDTLP